jgi:serine/threonine protein kinase
MILLQNLQLTYSFDLMVATSADVRVFLQVRELEGGDKSSIERCPESSCLSELRILCSLGTHPCIVTFYGHQFMNVQDRSLQLLIFMEHIQGGSLEDLLQDMAIKGQTSMPTKLACQVARNLACALAWLHSKGILHRDVKSSNVLIDIDAKQSPDGGPIVKLCDFDRAVPLSSSAVHTCYLAHRGVPSADVCVGTPRWIAPEVLRAMYGRHPYGFEADIWSFGCLLSELLTLHVPYAGLSESEVHSRIQVLTPLQTYVIVGSPIVMPKFRYALRLFMAIATTIRGK